MHVGLESVNYNAFFENISYKGFNGCCLCVEVNKCRLNARNYPKYIALSVLNTSKMNFDVYFNSTT